MSSATTYPICAKISYPQLAELDAFIEQFYPHDDRSSYIRLLIAQDMRQHGVHWSEYEFIGNEDRAEKGLPWQPWTFRNSPENGG